MPIVRIRENEPFESAMRRFKRLCEKSHILAEVHRREFYEKPTTTRKRKAAAAVKRHLRRLSRENQTFTRRERSSTTSNERPSSNSYNRHSYNRSS